MEQQRPRETLEIQDNQRREPHQIQSDSESSQSLAERFSEKFNMDQESGEEKTVTQPRKELHKAPTTPCITAPEDQQ